MLKLQLWRFSENYFALRVFNKQFVGRNNENRIVAVANVAQDWEIFKIVRKQDDPNRVRLKSTNGFFLQVPTY